MVVSTLGYPGFENDGYFLAPLLPGGDSQLCQGLVLAWIKPDSWAEKNTDLGNYIGWRILKVNNISVANLPELNAVEKTLSPHHLVEYTLGFPNVHHFQ